MLLQNTYFWEHVELRTCELVRPKSQRGGKKLQQCPSFQKGVTSQDRTKAEQNSNLSVCKCREELQLLSNQLDQKMDSGPGPANGLHWEWQSMETAAEWWRCVGYRGVWIQVNKPDASSQSCPQKAWYVLHLGEKLIQPWELEPLSCHRTSTGHLSVFPGRSPLPCLVLFV